MKKIISALILCVVFVLAGCASVEPKKTTSPAPKSSENEKVKSSNNQAVENLPIAKRIYSLQHKIMPKWVFESNGKFYDDLKSGNGSVLVAVANRLVSEDYAKKIVVKPIPNSDAVLIEFPEPEDFTLCFFVLIKKVGANYEYFTYEKTFAFGDLKPAGVVGGWDKDGSHSNFGSRTYKTADEFLKDVLKTK